MEKENLEKIFDFFHIVGKLKETYRFSENKVVIKESTADHSWRLSLMAFVIIDELKLDINAEHAVKIAIIHDIAESITGDIDYRLIHNNKVSKEEKRQNELKAIKKLKESLPEERGNEIYNLWIEYEEGATKESKFIKALDKLETLTYLTEKGHKSYDDPEMSANYADKAVEEFPELKDMLKTIKKKLKAEFEKGNIPWKSEYDNLN